VGILGFNLLNFELEELALAGQKVTIFSVATTVFAPLA